MPHRKFSVLVFLCRLLQSWSSAPLPLRFNTTTPVGTVDPGYVSYTLDWWPPSGGCPPNGWGPNANVLEVDLTSPKLRMLVSALGPSFLRIGGTRDKLVQYEIPSEGAFCEDPTVPCLNASRWNQLHEFARATNSRIAFGLSYPMTSVYGQWNVSQAMALLRYSQAQNYSRETTLYGFELGEELSRFHEHTEAFHNYVRAYQECADLLLLIYGSQQARPLLMGPCPGMDWPHLASWFPAFLKATRGFLDVADYHSYNQIEEGKLYLNFTIPTGNLSTAHKSVGDTGWQAAALKEFVDNAQDDNLLLWLGEMGPHNGCGGKTNISKTFASSFAYLDSLGSLARLNHRVLARQTLVGGKYELLQCTTTNPNCSFEPQPDYWIALLWRRLMGTIVLEAPTIVEEAQNASWKEALRFHAHCSALEDGSLVLAFSNASPNKTFAVLPTSLLGTTRVEYLLTGYGDGFQSTKLELNGSILKVGNSDQLPTLEGHSASNGPLIIRPITLGFVVFPEANAPACGEDTSSVRAER